MPWKSRTNGRKKKMQPNTHTDNRKFMAVQFDRFTRRPEGRVLPMDERGTLNPLTGERNHEVPQVVFEAALERPEKFADMKDFQ
jgi:hypothetical protein